MARFKIYCDDPELLDVFIQGIIFAKDGFTHIETDSEDYSWVILEYPGESVNRANVFKLEDGIIKAIEPEERI